MRKKIFDELPTKAKKRERKKRQRMLMHSRALLTSSKHSGKKLAKR
jgi:hypothetical protein